MRVKRTRQKQEKTKVVKNTNWYGFDHKKVNELFTGGLTYLNSFCVNGEYYPVAVYKVANPDKSKGHKKYLLLNGAPHNCVRGMDSKEMRKWRYQDAICCLKCNTIIYSVNRHHMNSCECGSISIDGGRDYTKLTYKEDIIYEPIVLDLLTNKEKK